MKATIYHNPRCSKSRQGLQLLTEHGVDVNIVEYLSSPPSHTELKKIIKLLGIAARDLLRKNEAAYKENHLSNLQLSDDDIIAAMINEPKLIERPIVIVDGKKAVIGRPPESILEIIR